jgi:hypothetical protein
MAKQTKASKTVYIDVEIELYAYKALLFNKEFDAFIDSVNNK